MNIVYLLTNKNKESGKRFYIGSKSECKIVNIGGVKTMITVSTGKPYMSSSTSFEFKQDIEAGHIFEVSVLEEVSNKDRSKLVEIENEWIIKMDAVKSEEFYNLGHAILNMRQPSNKLANKFGETITKLAKNNSSIGKRDATAKELGFDNFGEFYFEAYEKYLDLKNWAAVSSYYGKERHIVGRCLKGFDMEKAKKDLVSGKQEELRKLIAANCSLVKACEILDIELPAGRILLGNYGKQDRNFSVSYNSGKTLEEMEIEITKQILDGKGFREVSNEMGIVYESVKRHFFNCIRSRLKSSDL